MKIKVCRLILIGMIFFLFMLMAGCTSQKHMTYGEPVTIDGCVEVTAENVLVSSQVFPPLSGDSPMGWSTNDEKKTYVSVILKIDNLGKDLLTINDLWQCFSLHINGEALQGSIVALTSENDTRFKDDGAIEPGKAEKVYFITEVSKADLQKEIEAEFEFKKTTSICLPVDGTKPVAVSEPLPMGVVIDSGKAGFITMKSLDFTERLEPANPGYTYEAYGVKSSEEQLLVLKTEVENSAKTEQSAAGYFSLMVFYREREYVGHVIADDAHAANILSGQSIAPGEKRNVYGAISMPKLLKKEDLLLYVYVDGKYYQWKQEQK